MLRRAADITILRYLVASALALAVDMATFLALLQSGVAPSVAAMSGYSLGIAAHWLMSSRAVFLDGLAELGPDRLRQKVLFVLSALLGLGLTTGIVSAGARLGLDPRVAKIGAIAVSFTTNWLVRRMIVFRAPVRA